MFAWTDRPTHALTKDQLAAQKASREAMYRRELEDRAGLLLRLGHSAAYIKARLAANTAWDFELSGKGFPAAEIDKIVDAVARRIGKR